MLVQAYESKSDRFDESRSATWTCWIDLSSPNKQFKKHKGAPANLITQQNIFSTICFLNARRKFCGKPRRKLTFCLYWFFFCDLIFLLFAEFNFISIRLAELWRRRFCWWRGQFSRWLPPDCVIEAAITSCGFNRLWNSINSSSALESHKRGLEIHLHANENIESHLNRVISNKLFYATSLRLTVVTHDSDKSAAVIEMKIWLIIIILRAHLMRLPATRAPIQTHRDLIKASSSLRQISRALRRHFGEVIRDSQ